MVTKTYKIVHCANFSYPKNGQLYYATDNKISLGLIRNGHFVYEFSHRDVARCSNIFGSKFWGVSKTNKKLIATCKNIKPDLLLLGHSELITLDTLREIKEIIPDIKIAMWFVDPLWMDHHIKNILSKLPLLDSFFVTTGGELLRQFKTPSNSVAYMPNMTDISIESHKNFEQDTFDTDFLFCGRDYKEPERQLFIINLFKNLKSYKSKFFGCLGAPLVFGNQYVSILGNTKMALSYNRRNDVTLYMSDRIAQLTGNGIVAFTPRVPCMEILYAENEVVYFDESTELLDKIEDIMRDDELRKTIAYNGWKKTQSSYNNTRVTKFMLETIFNKDYSESYEWLSEVYL